MNAPKRCMTSLFSLMLAIAVFSGCNKSTENAAEKPAKKQAAKSGAASKTPKLNVVMINVSGLRADRLVATADKQSPAPFLSQLASDGLSFQQAYAAESYTLPSVASLFTGLYPQTHKALYAKPEIQSLDDKTPTLASVLSAKGYACAAIVSGAQMAPGFNLSTGFKPYKYIRSQPESAPTESAATRWTLSNTSEEIFNSMQSIIKKPRKPLFLYLHFSDLQMPCLPPEPYNASRATAEEKSIIETIYQQKLLPKFNIKSQNIPIALYDGTVSYVDHWIERTIKHLDSIGITRDNSIFIITADRGQEIFDKHSQYASGSDVGRSLYAEQIQVPLMILMPGTSGKAIADPIELVDVPTTLLDVLKISWGKGVKTDGRSLLPLINHDKKIKRVVYSGGSHGRGAIIDGRWKYIESPKETRGVGVAFNSAAPADTAVLVELYNLKSDPGEKRNLAEKMPDVVSRMKSVLEAKRTGAKLPPASKPAKEVAAE